MPPLTIPIPGFNINVNINININVNPVVPVPAELSARIPTPPGEVGPLPPSPKTMSMYHHQTGDFLGRFTYEELEPPEPSAPTHRSTRKKGVNVPEQTIRLGCREDLPDVPPTEGDDEIQILDITPSISAPNPPSLILSPILPSISTRIPSQTREKPEAKPTLKGKAKVNASEDLPAPQTIFPIGSPDGPLTMHHLEQLREIFNRPMVGLIYNFFENCLNSHKLAATYVHKLHNERQPRVHFPGLGN